MRRKDNRQSKIKQSKTKDRRGNRRVEIDDAIFTMLDEIYKQYEVNASEDNLNCLLELYQRLVPTWVEDFNTFSSSLREKTDEQDKIFDDFLKVELPEGYSIEDLKAPKNKEGDIKADIMQRGRIIHLANKIAHQFGYRFDIALKSYMTQKDIIVTTKAQYYEIKKLMRRIYGQTTKESVREASKEVLYSKYGFIEEDFEHEKNLEALNLPELIRGFNVTMYMKDMEIENVAQLAHNHGREDISYGLRRDDEDNYIFVMDVEKFGQFAVHVKDPSLISQIRRQYKMPIYRRETMMLVDYTSEKSREFMEDSRTDDSMDEERQIPTHVDEERKQRTRLMEEIKYLDLTRGEKHEIAVKGGLHREELEEIDEESER